MAKSHTLPKNMDMPTQCPFCGHLFDYTMYPEIHIPGDHKVKKMVLNKTLFFPKCPECKEQFKIKTNCIYRNDNKREIFIVTDSTEAKFEAFLKTGDLQWQDVFTENDLSAFAAGLFKRRVVYDVDAFREKILLSEYNFDDRIIELMKLSLAGLLEKENHTSVYRIFLDEAPGTMLEFVAIMGSHAPFEYITASTPVSVYNHFRDKYLKDLGRPEEDKYISTDQKWAAASGLLEDEDPGFVIPV